LVPHSLLFTETCRIPDGTGEREGRQVPFAPGMLIVLVMKPAHVEPFSQLFSCRSLDHEAGQFNMLRKDLRNYGWQRIYTFQNKEFAFKSSETMTGTSLQRPQKKYNTLPEIRNNANLYIAMRGNIQKRDMISILILTPPLGLNFLKIKRKHEETMIRWEARKARYHPSSIYISLFCSVAES